MRSSVKLCLLPMDKGRQLQGHPAACLPAPGSICNSWITMVSDWSWVPDEAECLGGDQGTPTPLGAALSCGCPLSMTSPHLLEVALGCTLCLGCHTGQTPVVASPFTELCGGSTIGEKCIYVQELRIWGIFFPCFWHVLVPSQSYHLGKCLL